MPTFAYQGRDQTGERVSGTREATDQRAALEALREMGLFVTQLAPSATGGKAEGNGYSRTRGEKRPNETHPAPSSFSTVSQAALSTGATSALNPSRATEDAPAQPVMPPPPIPTSIWPRANAKERSLYFQQMHAMINAGTSIGHALKTMSEHAPSRALRKASGEMSEATSGGHPWSETLKAYPSMFDELTVGMIGAGENGGFLDRMCLRLADYAERDYELQQTVKRETWYPKLLMFCSILIPSAVPLVVTAHFGGNALAAWLSNVGPPFIVVGLAWVAWKAWNRAFPLAARRGPIRLTTDWIKLQIPFVNKTTRALAAAKFCRAMGALYASGMGAHQLIDIAAGASGNAAFARSARETIPLLEKGSTMTDALASTRKFPGIALQMMRTGEMAGNIDTQLDKVADFLEQDAETAIKQAVKVFGILVFLLMAIYIGQSVVGQYSTVINNEMDEGDKIINGG